MKNLIPVDYANQRVLTYNQVAKGLNCSIDQLRSIYHNHKEEFTEGVHFFNVTGEPLRALKKDITNRHVNLHANSHADDSYFTFKFVKGAKCIKLWSCQGVARLSKLIDTPEAWELFTKLEKNYFERQAEPAAPVAESAPTEPVLSPLELFHELIAIADKIEDDPAVKNKILCEAVTILIGKKIF